MLTCCRSPLLAKLYAAGFGWGAGTGRLPVCRPGGTARVLYVDSGRERSRTVVEEGHLQGHRSSRRGRPRVLQVIQLAGAARRLLTSP